MHLRTLISGSKLLSRHSLQGSSSVSKSLFHLKSFVSFSNEWWLDTISWRNPKGNPNHHFLQVSSLSSSSKASIFQNLRLYSVETDREVDKINLKFAEAREEIESAMESKETVYFDEEAECARAVVKEVLDLYEGLLAKLPDNEKSAIQRSMGLKIEQLKAELEQLNE